MIVINLAHPLTDANLEEITALSGETIIEIIEAGKQIDTLQALIPQLEAHVKQIGFSTLEWQTKPILINLPSLNYSTAALLAMLHGITGHFPAILRLRPDPGSIVPKFVVAEIINLQDVREKSRLLRDG